MGLLHVLFTLVCGSVRCCRTSQRASTVSNGPRPGSAAAQLLPTVAARLVPVSPAGAALCAGSGVSSSTTTWDRRSRCNPIAQETPADLRISESRPGQRIEPFRSVIADNLSRWSFGE